MSLMSSGAGRVWFGLSLWTAGWLLAAGAPAWGAKVDAAVGAQVGLAAGEVAPSPRAAGGVPADLTDELHAFSDAAAVVFTGGVLSVRHVAGEGGGPGVVEVRFSVEQAVRGCVTGSVYTLREWAGLWEGGDERYRVGERFLMFLHAPGTGGLSSPVGGRDGAVPLLAETGKAGQGRGSEQVDLRWMGARVGRPVVYRQKKVWGAAQGLAVAAGVTGGSGPTMNAASVEPRSVSVVVDGVTGGRMLPEVQSGPADAVLMMLRGWQKEQVNAR